MLFFATSVNATDYLSPGDTALTFPPEIGGARRDLYANEEKDVFLLITATALWQMDYAHTKVVASVAALAE